MVVPREIAAHLSGFEKWPGKNPLSKEGDVEGDDGQ